MKTYVRYIIVCLFTLSPAICRAGVEAVYENFEAMYNASTLEVKNSNHTGKTSFVTYTCSGGAEFSKSDATSYVLAIFLNASGKQVVTSAIQNLDSLRVYHSAPSAQKNMTVSIKEGDGEWRNVPVSKKQNGVNSYKMPRAGDYQVRIQRSDNIYITQIDYFYVDLSDCPNCFLYKP